MSLRQRIVNWVGGDDYQAVVAKASVHDDLVTEVAERADLLAQQTDELQALRYTANLIKASMDFSPWVWADEGLHNKIKELDADAYHHLKQMEAWEQIGSLDGSQKGVNEEDRREAMRRSRWAYDHLLLFERMVQMWTDFCLGRGFHVTVNPKPKDGDEAITARMQAVWDDFVSSASNRYLLDDTVFYRQSEKEIRDGEVFWVLFRSTLDGTVIIRSVPSDEITQIICDENDKAVPTLYRRQIKDGLAAKDIWYRDYRATDKMVAKAKKQIAVENDKTVRIGAEGASTDVVVMHIFYKDSNGRGWPILAKGVGWARAYEGYLQDRVALQKAVLAGYEDVTVPGGSRAISSVIQQMQSGLVNTQFETNAPPSGPSPFVHNEGLSRRRMSLSTAASDARMDSMLILSYAGLAGGIPPGWIGRPDSLQNRAVAETLLRPVMEQWQRYTLLWERAIEALCREVLRSANTWPNTNPMALSDEVDDIEIDVVLDTPQSVEFNEMIKAVADIHPLELLPNEDLTRVLLRLDELGIDDPDAVMAALYPEGGEDDGKPDGKPDGEPDGDGDSDGDSDGDLPADDDEGTAESALLSIATANNMSLSEIRGVLQAAEMVLARGGATEDE